MPYVPLEDCEKSTIGHDMLLLEFTSDNIRLDDEDDGKILVKVRCRNCGVIAWERFESVDLLRKV